MFHNLTLISVVPSVYSIDMTYVSKLIRNPAIILPDDLMDNVLMVLT